MIQEYTQDGHKPECWIYALHHRGHGYLNVTSAIKQSCNYFFYEMGYRVGIDNLDKYAKAFGLSEKTGIELKGEQAGLVASPENLEARGTGETWTVGYTLSAAIGQEGHSFTPIQMAKYIAILANGGKQINPTIVKTIIKADGTEVDEKEIQNSVNQRIGREENQNPDIDISEENLKAILEGMRGVTSETSGTAYSVFRNFNIEVAGKTGTAETQSGTNILFVGFAPYENPEIVVSCIIENGEGSIASYPARDVLAEYFGMNVSQVEEDITARPYTESQN